MWLLSFPHHSCQKRPSKSLVFDSWFERLFQHLWCGKHNTHISSSQYSLIPYWITDNTDIPHAIYIFWSACKPPGLVNDSFLEDNELHSIIGSSQWGESKFILRTVHQIKCLAVHTGGRLLVDIKGEFSWTFMGEFLWTFLVNFRGVTLLSSNKLTQT